MKATNIKVTEHNWQDDPITDKQRKTIIKMGSILDWDMPMPETKGAAMFLIQSMMTEAEKRMAVTGCMGYISDFDGYGMTAGDIDDEEPDFGGN